MDGEGGNDNGSNDDNDAEDEEELTGDGNRVLIKLMAVVVASLP